MRMFAWIFDIVLAIVAAIAVILIINVVVGFCIQGDVFGTMTDSVSQAWPEMMFPLGVLLAIGFAFKHRPDRY